MIKLDLSKVLSRKPIAYVAGVIPGLFFLTSVALGAPAIAHRMITNLNAVVPLPAYALFIFFVASGFVLGHAFLQLAWFIELLLDGVHRLWRFGIRITFGSSTFYKWLAKLQGAKPNRNIGIRLFQWAVFAARMPRRYEAARPAMKCLGVASKELLRRRYGIDVSDSLSPNGEEWHVWHSVLGKPIKTIQESTTVMRSSLGCGLAGFLASVFASNLRTWYFYSLCGVFAATGLYMTWILYQWKTDPKALNTFRLASVLIELADARDTANQESCAIADDDD